MYFNIKRIGNLPGPTNKFERSLVFETGEFERPKFDCMFFKCSKEPYHGDTPKNCHITVNKNIFLKITHSYLEASHSVGSVVLIKDIII